MNIKQILSQRNEKYQNYALPIIYEWEDVIAKILDARIIKKTFMQRVANRFNMHMSLIYPFQYTFRFLTNANQSDEPINNKHIIPCIIDFFEKESQLSDFYAKHSKNKIVLLSSPFDYEYLKRNKCPLKLGLFAYSLSDKYALKYMNLEKKYDIVLTGRQDPLLYSFFKKYVKSHPNVSYVKRGKDIENDKNKSQSYYLNGKELISDLKSREDFIKLQAQGKVTLYSTQGYDNNTKDFFHMTPHFLEIIASGSHVLLHYPTDERGTDAKFYEFAKFSPSIETYEEFERAMDHALSTEINKEMYTKYLKKHYTSTRVKELLEIIKNI